MWVAKDKHGEWCFTFKPYMTKNGIWNNVNSEHPAWETYDKHHRACLIANYGYVHMPNGTINKLIGREISLGECIEITKCKT